MSPERPEDIFSRRAGFYATSKVHDDAVTLGRLVALASPRPEMGALDVGTGAGHTALALAPHVREVTAVDLTEAMMDQGRQLARQRGVANVRFMHADAMELPFPDGSFDLVTCRRAAHHFADVRRAVGEMVRVLRPGGRLVLDDRTVPEDDAADEAINHLDRLHDPSHVRDHRPSEWRDIVSKVGLAVASLELYARRMPLSHFTAMMEPAAADEFRRYARQLPDGLKALLNLRDEGGELFLDNFFVLLAADKRA